ncbi:YafY family protein [soil metagenome]
MPSNPTHRALGLLSLLSSRRGWTGPELAERLAVTDRTLRRDIDRLRGLGYRVDGTGGTGGGYELRATTDLPPLFLDDDEAVAIAAALLTATGSRSTGMADSSAQALAKLNQVLPAALFRRVAAVHAATAIVTGPGVREAPVVDPGTVAVLAEAARDRIQVRFTYETREAHRAERRVEPHSLATVGQLWYLIGFDLDRTDWRLFRVDRVRDPVATGHRCPDRELPDASPAEFVARGVVRAPMAHTAVVVVPLTADELLARRPSLLSTRIDPIETGEEGERSGGRCRVRLGMDTADELVGQVLGLLQAVEGCRVEAAPSVLDHVAEAGRRLLGSIGAAD